MLNRKSEGESSISNFDQKDKYLDSTFVGPFFKNILEETMGNDNESQSFVKKYIQQYYDYKNFRLSSYLYPISPSLSHNRVSGFNMGPYFSITQLKPMAFKFEYFPTYSFSLKQFHHSATFKRHPWGKESQEINITYHDEISSNDHWMRNDSYNTTSSIFYGKDYKDYFHKKGYSIDYTHHFTNEITLTNRFSNTNQFFLPALLNYKNKLFKKRDLDNRANFHTTPCQFENGRHVNIQTIFTLNRLNNNKEKILTYTVTLSDTGQHRGTYKTPEVYLIPESEGWPSSKYKMNQQSTSRTTDLFGGLVEIKYNNSTDSTNVQGDSIFTVEYFYDITIPPLPPGSHAYRFLIDSTRYDIDDENKERVINIDGILKTVSIINVENRYRFDIGYEYADNTLGSDFSYERLIFNFSTIYTLSSQEAITFRLLGGFSKKQLPIQKLFYIGGEGSVRGFNYLDTKKFSGNQMLLTKIEYHFIPFEDEHPFLFYDLAVIGNKFDFNSPITSYGLGIGGELDGEERDGMGLTFILYKTTDSNDGNWGVEIMYNYFFDQFDEGLEYILP